MSKQESQIIMHTEKTKLKKYITQILSNLLWLGIIAFLLENTEVVLMYDIYYENYFLRSLKVYSEVCLRLH